MAEFDFDAVVVGAGAVGLACGYALSKRGLSVAVLEKVNRLPKPSLAPSRGCVRARRGVPLRRPLALDKPTHAAWRPRTRVLRDLPELRSAQAAIGLLPSAAASHTCWAVSNAVRRSTGG